MGDTSSSKHDDDDNVIWNEELIIQRIAWFHILASIPIFVILYWFIPSPYGKLLPNNSSSSSSIKSSSSSSKSRDNPTLVGWLLGPQFPAKWSWMLFESPNLIWALTCWYCWWRQRRDEHQDKDEEIPLPTAIMLPNFILYAFFTLHYLQRGIYYPLCMSQTSKPVPLLVIVAALAFCSGNGYIQCRSLLRYQTFPDDWLWHGQFILGLFLAIFGAVINFHSDAILRRLKQQRQRLQSSSTRASSSAATTRAVAAAGQSDKHHQKQQGHTTSSSSSSSYYYQIPQGGGFNFCSCPHYFGELLEWAGFAMACQWSLVSVSFAVYTAANLIPRGVAQHAWYHSYFQGRYPKDRTAVIPFLF